MSKLKIKTESNPARCEVCHQTDYFDPINNLCQRCDKIDTVACVGKDNHHTASVIHWQQRILNELSGIAMAWIGFTFTISLLTLCMYGFSLIALKITLISAAIPMTAMLIVLILKWLDEFYDIHTKH